MTTPTGTGEPQLFEEQPRTSSFARYFAVMATVVTAGAPATATARESGDPGTDVTRLPANIRVVPITSLDGYTVTNLDFEANTATVMARLRKMTGLSLREWAEILQVSHSSIRDWEEREPQDRDLGQYLQAMEEVRRIRPDLKSWLKAQVPGQQSTPLDLLKDNRWRAFRGAARTAPGTASSLTPRELAEKRRAESSWAVEDAPLEVPGE